MLLDVVVHRNWQYAFVCSVFPESNLLVQMIFMQAYLTLEEP